VRRWSGKRTHVSVFGTDYPTPDGTGVRDYIHVADLASAHLRALDYLRGGGRPTTLNVGYGHGYSVREVLAMVQSVGGKKLDIREEPRRAGDPAYLVARAERIRAELGWAPRYDDLQAIVASALAWERKLQQDPWTPDEQRGARHALRIKGCGRRARRSGFTWRRKTATLSHLFSC